MLYFSFSDSSSEPPVKPTPKRDTPPPPRSSLDSQTPFCEPPCFRRGARSTSVSSRRRGRCQSLEDDFVRPRHTSVVFDGAALETVLAGDSSSFLQYAMSHALAGENILFLNHIRDWKRAWDDMAPHFSRTRSTTATSCAALSAAAERTLFNIAVEIYISFIDPSAPFPVNLEASTLETLQEIFYPAASSIPDVNLDSNITQSRQKAREVAPFNSFYLSPSTTRREPSKISRRRKRSATSTSTSDAPAPPSAPLQTYEDALKCASYSVNKARTLQRVPAEIPVPPRAVFHRGVFDVAERQIKVMLLRDLWKRYIVTPTVEEGDTNMLALHCLASNQSLASSSFDSSGSDSLRESEGRVSRAMKGFTRFMSGSRP